MSIRTKYEKWYEGDEYYWGVEPGDFLDELISQLPPSGDTKVLDIGCGEGKDAVYMAQKGYNVSAFDLTENGIRKTIRLASDKGVGIVLVNEASYASTVARLLRLYLPPPNKA